MLNQFKTKNKLGSIQISLSWVFMIMIGTFFIFIAYTIIGNYKQIQDNKSKLLLDETLRTILNEAGITTGIEKNTLIPLSDIITKKSIFQNKRVKITCQNGIELFSFNGNLRKNEFLNNYPSFMTKIDEGNIGYSYLAVENFKLPFKISNLLAFVSKKNLIIFDSDSDISKKLIFKFRKSYTQLNYRALKFSTLNLNLLKDEIKQNSDTSIAFISDNGINMNGISLNSFKIYAKHIQISEKNNGKTGTLNIQDNEGLNQNFQYIDLDNSLNIPTMAIFSRIKTFNCSYNLLQNLIKPIYSFYINKTSYYQNLSKNEKICSSNFPKSQAEINYKLLKNSLISSLNFIKQNPNIYNNAYLNLLLNINKNSLKLEDFNCPYVY